MQSKRGRSITQFIHLDNGSKICSNKNSRGKNLLTYIFSIFILNACASHKERQYTKHAIQKKSSIMAVCVLSLNVIITFSENGAYGASDRYFSNKIRK